jgi:bifunctional non-homologous end joining protein LigD
MLVWQLECTSWTVPIMADRIPFRVHPMLATLVDRPFDKPDWIYEEKYDGYRILAYKEGSRVTLFSRNGKDRTLSFSVVADAVRKLAAETLLLDGEVVVFDRHGVSHFQLLQEGSASPSYAVFDCLYFNGRDLRKDPLSERRATLQKLVPDKGTVFLSHQLLADGIRAFEEAKRKGYEGLVAKDLASPYDEERSSKWLKVKVHQEEEFVIAGYTAPTGSRVCFGALLLGAYSGKQLMFVGKVGTGFSRATLRSLCRQFQPLIRKTPSLVDPPREAGLTHLAPKFVAQIAFEEWTVDQKLRQPVFLGLRDDKLPEDCRMPDVKDVKSSYAAD